MNFDLAAVDTSAADEGVEMQITGPDGNPIKNSHGEVPTLILLGLDGKVYRDYQRRAILKRLRKSSLKGKTEKVADLTDDEMAADAEREALDQFVMMTVGWKNFRDAEGNVIEFHADAVRALYANYPMIGEQVDLFCATRANFIKGQSKGLSPSPKSTSTEAAKQVTGPKSVST